MTEKQSELAGIPPKPLDPFAAAVIAAQEAVTTAKELLDLAKIEMVESMKRATITQYCYVNDEGAGKIFEIDLKESLKVKKEA